MWCSCLEELIAAVSMKANHSMLHLGLQLVLQQIKLLLMFIKLITRLNQLFELLIGLLILR